MLMTDQLRTRLDLGIKSLSNERSLVLPSDAHLITDERALVRLRQQAAMFNAVAVAALHGETRFKHDHECIIATLHCFIVKIELELVYQDSHINELLFLAEGWWESEF